MTFPIFFFISNIFISLLLCCFLLFKKLLKNHLTVQVQYHLWYIFVFSLILPFIPYRFWNPDGIFLFIKQWISPGVSSDRILTAAPFPGPSLSIREIRDSSIAAASSSPWFTTVLWLFWISGMLFTFIYFLSAMLKIYFLRQKAYSVTKQTEPELYHHYVSCIQELHIRRNIRLYASCNLSSPVSYGWIFPRIIIPQDLDITLSLDEIRFVFLHELEHYKHRDALFNDLICILQSAYWFNPLIWYGFGQLRKDRELACDNSVINVIGEDQRRDYGYTIIRYAEQIKKGWFLSPLSSIGSYKNTTKQRIQAIADYKKDSVSKKRKSRKFLFLALLLVCISSPLFTANASGNSVFHFTEKNWSSIDVSSYFNGIDGSFVLYDVTEDHYQIFNRELSEQRISPDSTFKIYSGLFALEEHLITPDSSSLEWDGTRQMFPSWNQDQTLDSAMKDSVNWYFQNLDNQLGLSELYSYYRKISYGNCDLSGGISSYWAESSLKISPLEQVILLSGLLKNQWGFQEQNIEAIKNALFQTNIPAGKLYGKTGTGSVNGNNVNGWFVGFLEHQGNLYCFSTNLQASPSTSGGTAADITVDILNRLFTNE